MQEQITKSFVGACSLRMILLSAPIGRTPYMNILQHNIEFEINADAKYERTSETEYERMEIIL